MKDLQGSCGALVGSGRAHADGVP
ncbi:hypothetical protein PMI12_04474, partial [Variovorax sp. CF313]